MCFIFLYVLLPQINSVVLQLHWRMIIFYTRTKFSSKLLSSSFQQLFFTSSKPSKEINLHYVLCAGQRKDWKEQK